ncbi:MAG: SulP family inorganic anion transporter [Saprospiraceae bacterium]|nr:SulP family inorganic anion transporter [Saprospiraceae bacterium]
MESGLQHNLLTQWRKDIPAGIVVFLVALPLCLGIALASGAPLMSGLITGIIGGIVVGGLSGSALSVSGPAAGLAVIVLDSISSLGSFDAFLVAVVLAGVFQVILGYLKAGIIGLYFPVSVIKGMLAAIGIILILKQIPHFLGIDMDAFGEMSFRGTDGRNTFEELIYGFTHIHQGAFIIGILALVTMLGWDNYVKKWIPSLGLIPGALLAVILGIVIRQLMATAGPGLEIGLEHAVQIPIPAPGEGLTSLLTFPDWSAISFIETWKVAVVIAIIASLETLLSVEAVDKLDHHKRHTPLNREMKAQGVGNFLSGLIGGLPMTAVIVRSSANVEAGAESKLSAIVHGILLAGCVIGLPHLLNQIPLSALAAILLIIGFKLTKPTLYKSQMQSGIRQFLPFITTIIGVLLTDLLTGIVIGLAVGIFYVLKTNYKTPYFYHEEAHPDRDGHKVIKLVLSEHVSFLNKASLQLTLDHLPEHSDVIIDGSQSKEIDFDAVRLIHNFKEMAKDKHITLELIDIPEY